MSKLKSATLLAGIPSENPAFFHRVRFAVGDPAAWIAFEEDGLERTEFIVRDIEKDRAIKQVNVDRVSCPADYAPAEGLSGDRATATAQAVAECARRAGVQSVTTDRTLPFIFAWHLQQAGLAVVYSADLGVLDRRVKDAQELDWLQAAQTATEAAMLMACQTVARATAKQDGTLEYQAAILTSERLRKMISVFLLDLGYSTPHDSIVASLPQSADCHERGSGPLRTGESVIIDIFPQFGNILLGRLHPFSRAWRSHGRDEKDARRSRGCEISGDSSSSCRRSSGRCTCCDEGRTWKTRLPLCPRGDFR